MQKSALLTTRFHKTFMFLKQYNKATSGVSDPDLLNELSKIMGDIALTVSSVMRGIVDLGSFLETSEMVVKEGHLKGKPCVVGIADNAQSIIPPNDWVNIYISTATPCADTRQY